MLRVYLYIFFEVLKIWGYNKNTVFKTLKKSKYRIEIKKK